MSTIYDGAVAYVSSGSGGIGDIVRTNLITREEKALLERVSELERQVLAQRQELKDAKNAYQDSLSALVRKQILCVNKVDQASSEAYAVKVSMVCIGVIAALGVIWRVVMS